MPQILPSLLILLNPAIGFFAPSNAPIQNATRKEAAFINLNDYKLPISENMFLASQLVPTYPIRNWNSPDPEITAKIAFVFETTRQRILWQKNGLRESQPIASLTKLMTALIVMENAKLDDVFTVSKNAVQTTGEMGGLVVGEELTVKNLLYALLVESSNDAAVALAKGIDNKIVLDSAPQNAELRSNNNITNFVDLMNQKAKNMGLANTNFADPSGLDPGNRSSAWDMNRLMQEVLKYQVLQNIMQTSTIDFQSVDGKFNHHIAGTDKLLGKLPEIIGGKTGYTEEAGNCMILAWRAPNGQGIVISIIMDSQDRMAESEALLTWTKEAFLW